MVFHRRDHRSGSPFFLFGSGSVMIFCLIYGKLFFSDVWQGCSVFMAGFFVSIDLNYPPVNKHSNGKSPS